MYNIHVSTYTSNASAAALTELKYFLSLDERIFIFVTGIITPTEKERRKKKGRYVD